MTRQAFVTSAWALLGEQGAQALEVGMAELAPQRWRMGLIDADRVGCALEQDGRSMTSSVGGQADVLNADAAGEARRRNDPH